MSAEKDGTPTPDHAALLAGVQRYDLVSNYRCYQTVEEMERSTDGEWVRYDDVTAALTSPVTGEAGGWQPIETAPKDARAIVGETWDGHVHPVWWNKTYPRWEWCGDGYHSGAAPRLVRWMPIPPPEATAPTGEQS